MGTSYSGSTGLDYVLCPFVIGVEARTITCEGITDRCTVKLQFRAKDERVQHMRIFCEAKYANCEVCRMLMRDKYGQEGGEE